VKVPFVSSSDGGAESFFPFRGVNSIMPAFSRPPALDLPFFFLDEKALEVWPAVLFVR